MQLRDKKMKYESDYSNFFFLFLLAPYFVLCSAAASSYFHPYGLVIYLGFIRLKEEESQLMLKLIFDFSLCPVSEVSHRTVL